VIITGILQGYLFAACLSHVEHLFAVDYLTIVNRWGLINKVWVSQYFNFLDYLTLVEETGKVIRADKRGKINENSCALLTHLGINSDDWLKLAENFGKQYHQAVGSLAELNAFAAHTGKQWIGGHRQQTQIFH
jgi:hypothetical protein